MQKCRSVTWGIAVLTGVLVLPAQAQSLDPKPAPETVDAIFKRYDNKHTPGCSVAVMDAGRALFVKSYGMADPSLGVPMSAKTTSWIPYSEARVFVGLAVAMLAKEGRITLEDRVRKHIPELPAYADAVTVRQLLHHTSGLADYGTLAGPGFELGDRLPEDQFFRILSRWGALISAPGTSEMYSNTDYALLKIMIERVSGGSFHDFLAARLFRPNNMTATQIGFDQSQVRSNHALFHEVDGDGFRRLLRYRISPVGMIAVTTRLDDLVRFDQALRDPKQGLMAMLKSLKPGSPRKPNNDEMSYAFGVREGVLSGDPIVKFGGVGDFNYLVQFPTRGLSVATLCNAYPGMDRFSTDVARLFLPSSEPTIATPQPKAVPIKKGPKDSVTTMSVPLSTLQSYVGSYQDVGGRMFVDVSLDAGELKIVPRGRPPFPPLRAVEVGKFETSLGGTPFALQFTLVDGQMVLTSWDLAANEPGGPPLRRTATWQPSIQELRAYSGVYVGENVDLTLHVREDNGRLLLATAGYAESEIKPGEVPNEFRLPEIYAASFRRDASGEVTALTLNASRVKGMLFKRAQ